MSWVNDLASVLGIPGGAATLGVAITRMLCRRESRPAGGSGGHRQSVEGPVVVKVRATVSDHRKSFCLDVR